uniref:DUF7202 domain-containing protein n=1 Tax=Escherichia phage UFV-AREG1 TaxID=1837867 RepID=A0A173GAT6_9CAUD
MNNFELRYEVLRNIDNLIELAVNKGFAIGIGQKDTTFIDKNKRKQHVEEYCLKVTWL